MWWKIYFAFATTWFVLGIAGSVLIKIDIYYLSQFAEYAIAYLVLYSYVFKQEIFPLRFLQIFFWVNLIMDALYLLYGFSWYVPALQPLSVILGPQKPSTLIAIGLVLLDIPWIYAWYTLSYSPKKVKYEKKAFKQTSAGKHKKK